MTRMLFVCLGNICRSPTVEAVARAEFARAGLDIEVDSAGTAGYHVGEPPDPRSIVAAAAHGYDLSPLRAITDKTLQEMTAFLPGRPVQERMPASGGWVDGDAVFVGENPPGGAVISYYLRTRHIYGPIKLEVLDAKGQLIDTITPSKHEGINRVVWNMRVKPPRVPRARGRARRSPWMPPESKVMEC